MFKALLGVSIAALVIVAFLVTSTKADPLPAGAPAPADVVTDQDGKPLNLAEVYKKGPTLVYFYPKADTPGCRKQACSLRDSMADIQKAGIQIIGVSMDQPESQKAFQEKYTLPFPLVADPEGKLVKAFGVPMIRIGFSKRQSFLVRDGRIVWHDPEVDPETHVKKVLEAAEKTAVPAK